MKKYCIVQPHLYMQKKLYSLITACRENNGQLVLVRGIVEELVPYLCNQPIHQNPFVPYHMFFFAVPCCYLYNETSQSIGIYFLERERERKDYFAAIAVAAACVECFISNMFCLLGVDDFRFRRHAYRNRTFVTITSNIRSIARKCFENFFRFYLQIYF